jgi:hypothetical protein
MSEVSTALVTGISTVLAPVVTLYLDRHLKSKKYKNIDADNRQIVQGKWSGYFRQELNGESVTFGLSLDLRVSATGMLKGKAKFIYNKKNIDIRVNGGFYLDEFLKMNYYNSNSKIIQFGAFVFKVDYELEKLNGQFVGYGPVSKKVISGPAILEKQDK